MLMLYKYLFYGVSYYVKKYDNLWNVGETYYVGGAIFVGMAIDTLLFNIYRLLGILWLPELLNYKFTFLGRIWPLFIPLVIAVYLGITGKHSKIYDEVANMEPKKKRKFKVLNIIHLLIIYGFMVVLSDYIRYYIRGFDSPLFEWIESL